MSNELVVGATSMQSTYEPWPNTWTYPYVYPTTTVYTVQEEYANEVEVEQGTHDAVLRFYRRRGQSRSLVREVTVPLGLLEWLQAETQ